jgi:peptidoglycan/LPS O-acetylase OafA/YrhL
VTTSPVRRSVQLDVVRAVAILLVLGQHYDYGRTWLSRFGWTGVDLFFVLSGFLVSGLLFDELSKTGAVDGKRFLIRRGFKIYPAFWAMILTTVIGFKLLGTPLDRRGLLCELLFVQNYGRGLWAPTWSLGVEEHFYFGLAIVVAWLAARRGQSWLPRVPRTLFVLLFCVLVVRCLGLAFIPWKYKLVFWGTHARVDGLLFGTLLSYCHRYRPAVRAFVERRRWIVLAGSLLLIAPAFLLGEKTLVVRTVGVSLLYLGFGGILLFTLYTLNLRDPVSRTLATIGRYSYGIYIWHEPLQSFVVEPLHLTYLLGTTVVGFFPVSIVSGIGLSAAIEIPFLKLRDRYFPAATTRGQAPATQSRAA